MDLEEYALDRCPVPDLRHLSKEKCKQIDELWEKLKSINVPSLLEQLEGSHPFRLELDDGLLQILGIDDQEQKEFNGESI